MVDINLTIVVELLLFLIFLWAVNRFIFRPTFKTLDGREDKLRDDTETAEALSGEAAAMEQDYSKKHLNIYREASHAIYHGRRAAQHDHNKVVETLKKEEEQEVALAHDAAMAAVDQERKQYPALAADLSKTMADKLGLGR